MVAADEGSERIAAAQRRFDSRVLPHDQSYIDRNSSDACCPVPNLQVIPCTVCATSVVDSQIVCASCRGRKANTIATGPSIGRPVLIARSGRIASVVAIQVWISRAGIDAGIVGSTGSLCEGVRLVAASANSLPSPLQKERTHLRGQCCSAQNDQKGEGNYTEDLLSKFHGYSCFGVVTTLQSSPHTPSWIDRKSVV